MTRIFLKLWSRLRGLFDEEGSNREFCDEIETHIALLTETYVHKGMSEQDAMYAARGLRLLTLRKTRLLFLRGHHGMSTEMAGRIGRV